LVLSPSKAVLPPEEGLHAGEASHSARLRSKVDLVWPALAAAGRKLLTHSRVRHLYPEYLITFHGIVRASVPLMESALDRARALGRGDRVAVRLAEYLEDHLPEEMDHDRWVLDDLEALGVDRASVLTRPPSVAVAQLVGAQYYWLFHYHPVALLGYITLLEGYPPLPDEIEDLITKTGHGRAAFRTLLHHAALDPHHAAGLFATIDALPLSPEQSAVLGASALSSAYLLTEVVHNIARHAGGEGVAGGIRPGRRTEAAGSGGI